MGQKWRKETLLHPGDMSQGHKLELGGPSSFLGDVRNPGRGQGLTQCSGS